MRILTAVLSVLLLCGVALAQATAGDMPLPAPTATIIIKDIGSVDAPARCLGTASAYVKPQPNSEVMTWDEEDNLSVKNTSDKDISKFAVALTWTDVRGNTATHSRELDFEQDQRVFPAGTVWAIGRGRHIPGGRYTVSQAEYDPKAAVEPKVECQIAMVFFTDGSVWPEGAKWPEPTPAEKAVEEQQVKH